MKPYSETGVTCLTPRCADRFFRTIRQNRLPTYLVADRILLGTTMSYLIQKSYAHQHDPQHDQHDVHQDQDSKPQLSHNGRINISPAYDPNYPPHTTSPSYSSDHQPATLPKVGQTRCCKFDISVLSFRDRCSIIVAEAIVFRTL